jgi:hypothetical protein
MAIALATLQRGRSIRPPKTVIYGGPKVGKSTFGAGAPDVVFIQTEEGLDDLDVTRFPMAQTFDDVMGALETLATEEHGFKYVVLDSLDWTEPLVWAKVAGEAEVASIEEVGGGWGKGYVEALKLWKELLNALDYLRNERGMGVIVIAHAEIRRMTPPDAEPYDFAALKLHKRAAAVVEEWADIIGYASPQIAIRKDDLGFKKSRTRALALGVVHTLHVGQNPAYVSGNRYSMPSEMPLLWDEFAKHLPGAEVTEPELAEAAS